MKNPPMKIVIMPTPYANEGNPVLLCSPVDYEELCKWLVTKDIKPWMYTPDTCNKCMTTITSNGEDRKCRC